MKETSKSELLLSNFIPQNLTITNKTKKLFHVFNEDDCYALWAAWSAGRPLLVRGKPGTGKSQMARAIAEQLGWGYVSEVVRGNTELSDLYYSFDAIGRLGEAQALGCQPCAIPAPSDADSKKPTFAQAQLAPKNFLSPGSFWWAYNWQSAQDQYDICDTGLRPPPEKPDIKTQQGKSWEAESGGVVLLIDEIDKGEPDLPNGLLETLGQYQFTVPYLNRKNQTTTEPDIKNPVQADPSRLLIVITTNEERELPQAFVRRCFVHTLKMQDSKEIIDGQEKRYQWLMERGKLHFGTEIDDKVYVEAARQLWQDRTANPHTPYLPGLAEYLDLLKALESLDNKDQLDRLHRIAEYALQKEEEK